MLFHIMTGWFEYGVFIGATTVLTIILKKTEVQLLRQRRHHRDDHRNHEEGVANPYTKISTM